MTFHLNIRAANGLLRIRPGDRFSVELEDGKGVSARLADELHEYNNPQDVVELRGDDGVIRMSSCSCEECKRDE